MKPIIKVLTSPFRSSKSSKLKDQGNQRPQLSNQTVINDLENNIDLHKGLQNEIPVPKDLYSKIEKMVDQLGSLLHFKQKISESQKRQLINELSSMAINDKGIGNKLFDEDVLDSEDEENPSSNPTSLVIQNQSETKQKKSEPLTRSNSLQKSDSPKSQESPENKLKELFEHFNSQQQTQTEKRDLKKPEDSKKDAKDEKEGKESSLSSFSEIKSQMSRFFMKNSSKVLRLMKSKKQSLPEKISQQLKQAQEVSKQVPKQKKKKSIIGSMFGSWNGKKENKALKNKSTSCCQKEKQNEDEKQKEYNSGADNKEVEFQIE